MKRKLTQKEAIFWKLYQRFKLKNADYMPVHELMGEIYCEPLAKWGYVSYECSARASEIIKENPALIQRSIIRGRSGATYYGYRINPAALPWMVVDPKLAAFYRSIGGKKV